MEFSELELCRKLLATSHLSVPERRALPNGRARFSVLVAAAQEALAESGWFPFELKPDQDLGDRAVLEFRDGEFWVHEQHEIGVMRFSPIQSFPVDNVADAVRHYIKANRGDPIDGVPVDWHA
jgi:hypothetical protein